MSQLCVGVVCGKTHVCGSNYEACRRNVDSKGCDKSKAHVGIRTKARKKTSSRRKSHSEGDFCAITRRFGCRDSNLRNKHKRDAGSNSQWQEEIGGSGVESSIAKESKVRKEGQVTRDQKVKRVCGQENSIAFQS